MEDSILRKIVNLEQKLEDANNDAEFDEALSIETELQILKVFYSALRCSSQDPTYLKRKSLSLVVRPEIVNSLSVESRLSVLCLTSNECQP